MNDRVNADVFETARPGDRIPQLCRDIDLTTLVRYAGASGDFNPIHFDESYARAAGLDGVIGQGMLGMGLVSRAITDWVGDSRCVRDLSVRFTGSFHLGDRLTVSATVVDRQVFADGRTQLDLALTCTNQVGIEIIGRASAVLVSERSREQLAFESG
jgi:acyl dehydratase